jgi:hypothetical protein
LKIDGGCKQQWSLFLQDAVGDNTPLGLLSNIPALRSRLLQDADAVGDDIPMLPNLPSLQSRPLQDAVNDDIPLGLLSNLQALPTTLSKIHFYPPGLPPGVILNY